MPSGAYTVLAQKGMNFFQFVCLFLVALFSLNYYLNRFVAGGSGNDAVATLPSATTPIARGNVAVKMMQAVIMTYGPSQGSVPNLMAFTDLRERQLSIGGREVRLVCANDGIGEVVVEVDGQLYATGGPAMSKVREGQFWVVVDNAPQKPRGLDDGTDIARWSSRNWDDIRSVVSTMCPSAWPTTASNAVGRSLEAMRRGQQKYRQNAEKYGLEARL